MTFSAKGTQLKEKKMDLLSSLLEKGILVSPEVAQNPKLLETIAIMSDEELKGIMVIDAAFLHSRKIPSESSAVAADQERKGLEPVFSEPKNEKTPEPSSKVKVLFSYAKEPGKISVSDFVAYFNRRFESLSGLLRQRSEMQSVTSISRIKGKSGRESIALIGLVFSKSTTKNNNVLLTLEDPTGNIKVLISGKKKELLEASKEIVLDQAIGIEGVLAGNFVLANKLFLPDMPLIKELKKSPEEEYLCLLGDPHLGSKNFLKKEFEEFIEWINGRKGSQEQKYLASKIRYLVIIGDLVEGIGIYPGQEEDLEVKDIKQQYDIFAEYLKKIPQTISIVICPGNHDAGRISEPQPPLLHKYAESLKLPNVLLLSNPAMINIGACEGFSGFDLLLYHGYSLIYYADKVDTIRQEGGQKRPDLIMKLLLRMRHLAPTHTSNLYTPDRDFDPLFISKVPDFFITGHIHRVAVSNYKNITLLNCSCWSDISEDQEKRGLQPQPARVPLVNLKTREVKVINFFKDKKTGVLVEA